MKSSLLIGYGIFAVLFIIVIGVIFVLVKLGKNRAEEINRKLPSLSEVFDLTHKKEKVETVKLDPDTTHNQMNEAMSVKSEDEFNRKDYIHENKETTLDEDFGDLLLSPEEKIAKGIIEHSKKIKLPSVSEAEQAKDLDLPDVSEVEEEMDKEALEESKKDESIDDESTTEQNEEQEEEDVNAKS